MFFFLIRLMMMMMRGEMRIRPEETGPINWILFCPWLAMRWDWETCGGSLILPSKMVEVRVRSRHKNKRKISSENRFSRFRPGFLIVHTKMFLPIFQFSL